MVASLDFLVSRHSLADCSVQAGQVATVDVDEGQVLLRIDRFAFTANNITYAALGDFLRYWEFFPAPEGKGIIPVWGFAEVLASKCQGVDPGERFYGYYPMSTHLLVEPCKASANGFVDGSKHRQQLPGIYNQYIRCSNDPLYSVETEALQMLFRPLFTTSFLLDDIFQDNQYFGAQSLVLTSASSKTATGMAFLLQHHRAQREENYSIVGLTSAGNLEFVQGLGCYDRVLTYGQVECLEHDKPWAIVDFAGNAEVLRRLHTHLDQQLQYSCLVGASHWDQRGSLPKDLPGPTPQLFFAPSQAQKRLNEWGKTKFQQLLAERWQVFTTFIGGWLIVDYGLGVDAVEKAYQASLAGHFDPQKGLVLTLLSGEQTD